MLLSVCQIFVDCNVSIRICSRDSSIRDGICWGLVDVGHCRLMPLKALTLETVLTKPLPMMTTPTTMMATLTMLLLPMPEMWP